MFIDIHAHAYRKPVPFVTNFPTPEDVIRRYDAEKIDCGFLLPVVNPEIYLPQANEEILEMTARYPGRLFAFCNVDPRALTNSPDAPLDKVLAYYKEQGCLGVGEIMPNLPMLDPMVQNLFKCAEAAGLPVMCDGSDRCPGDFGLVDDPGLPQLEHTLQRFPKLTFFAHGPIFWAELGTQGTRGQRKSTFMPDGSYISAPRWKGPITGEGAAVTLLRRYPNLLGELSDAAAVLACDPEFGGAFLTEFQDRMFFGSDYCCVGMPFGAKELLLKWRKEGIISESVFRKIAYENARKFFQLPLPELS